MKCKSCGANIKKEQLHCPYCGVLNEVAQEQQKSLEGLKESNQDYKRQLLMNSGHAITYKIHKIVNIALFCVFILVTMIGFLVFMQKEGELFRGEGDPAVMARYYEEGDFDKLNQYMSYYEMFDPETNYEYSQMAILWEKYQDCLDYFAQAYEEYVQTGFYDAWNLEQCVQEGIDVLTAYSYSYRRITERNKEFYKPYQEQIYLLFTGVLQIPAEKLENLDPLDYTQEKEVLEYVLGVLANEE